MSAVGGEPEAEEAREVVPTPQPEDLFAMDGRVVVISGGTQGLGEEIARLTVARGAAGVALLGRDVDKGEAVAARLGGGCDVRFFPVELGIADECRRVMAEVGRAFGRVDGLVNAAASTSRGSVWDTTPELWDLMMAVNTRAPFLLLQAAALSMRQRGEGGSIVNIGSVAAHGGQEFLTPYAASKGALSVLTRNSAYQLMRHRIRVNQVNPGWMETEGEDVIQRRFHGATEGWARRAGAGLPFGRLLQPLEVARAVLFLLSEESGMMTGSIIDFDQSVLGAGDVGRPPVGPLWGERDAS